MSLCWAGAGGWRVVWCRFHSCTESKATFTVLVQKRSVYLTFTRCVFPSWESGYQPGPGRSVDEGARWWFWKPVCPGSPRHLRSGGGEPREWCFCVNNHLSLFKSFSFIVHKHQRNMQIRARWNAFIWPRMFSKSSLLLSKSPEQLASLNCRTSKKMLNKD